MHRLKIELKQNTKDWYQWRGKGIGASEAGTIMGENEYETAFELWTYKTGLLSKPEFNSFAKAAVDRGTKLEPEAREYFEKELGKKFPAVSYELVQYPFIRASLDGEAEDGTPENLEIKCPGKTAFDKALKGHVPPSYYAQMQQQMLVSGAELTHYGVYFKKDDTSPGQGKLIQVKADKAYQKQLTEKLIAFWNCVSTKTPPPVDATDLSKLVDRITKEAEKLFGALAALKVLNTAFTANHFGIGG